MDLDRLSILVAAAIFGGLALSYPRLGPFLRQRRIRPPHRALGLVFQVWFGLLAVACVVLFVYSRPHGR